MRFVELVIQGVRRFTGTHRLVFQHPHTWFSAPVAGGKSTVAALIRAALDHGYFVAVGEGWIPWRPTQETSRFALILENAAGERYRIAKDCRSGGVVAARFESGRFQTVASDAVAIADLLADRFDFPGPEPWQALYLWTDEGQVVAGGGVEMDVSEDPAALQARLEELLAEKALVENVDKVQFELDGVEDRRFQVEEELAGLAKSLERRERLQEELARTEAVTQLSSQDLEVARRFGEEWRRFEQWLLEREAALKEEETRVQGLAARPRWHRDPIFAGIAAVTVAGFVVPPLIKVYPLALLGFAGAGAIGWRIWRYKQEDAELTAERERFEAARSEFQERRREQEERFARLEELAKELGLFDVKELADAAERRSKLTQKLERLEQELAEAGVEARMAELRRELAELEARIEKLRGVLESSAGAEQRSAAQIEREIQELQRRLEVVRAGGGAGTVAVPVAGERLTPAERLQRAVAAAAQVARKEPEPLCEQLGAFATKVVRAVYDRIHEVRIAPDGTATWIEASSREPLAEREVHRGLWIATTAAVIVAAARVAAAARSFPLVWDEPFAELDDMTAGRLATVLAKAVGGHELVLLSGRRAAGAPWGKPIPLG